MKKSLVNNIERPRPNQSGRRNEITASSAQVSPTSSSSTFTPEEINVLRHTSIINGRSYKPFLPEFDLKEKFFFPIQFT
jgi:hypothetical protein